MKPNSNRSVGIAISSKFLTAAALLMLPALAFSGQTMVAETSSKPADIKSTRGSERPQIRVEKRTPAYWRVTFDNPPFNIFGPETIPQMEKVVAEIETDPKLRVVVFESAVPGFFLTHYNFTPPLAVEAVRLSRIRTKVRDAFVSPGLETTVFMNLRLSDLDVGGAPAQLATEVWAEDLVDMLRVTGQASAAGQPVASTSTRPRTGPALVCTTLPSSPCTRPRRKVAAFAPM